MWLDWSINMKKVEIGGKNEEKANVIQMIVGLQKLRSIKYMGNKSDYPSSTVDTDSFKLQHKKFDNAIHKKTRGRDIIQAQFPITNDREFKDWLKALNQSPGKDLEGTLKPTSFSFNHSGMCGTSGFAKIQYDNYPFVLKETIKDKQKSGRPRFKECQIWYLAYVLIQIGAKFHFQGKKVGDIRPLNIFINEDSQIKVATQVTWPNELTNYQKARQNQKTFLSPEEIMSLNIGFQEPKVQISEAEAFSVGLTLLDVTLLENSQKLYSKPNQLSHSELEIRKQLLLEETTYSELLRSTILSMLEVNFRSRMSLIQMYKWLESYSENILNMDRWICKEKPLKLEKIIQKNPMKKMSVQGSDNKNRKEKLRVQSKQSAYWQSRHPKDKKMNEVLPQKTFESENRKFIKSPKHYDQLDFASPKSFTGIEVESRSKQYYQESDSMQSNYQGKFSRQPQQIRKRSPIHNNFTSQNKNPYLIMSNHLMSNGTQSSNKETPEFKCSEEQSEYDPRVRQQEDSRRQQNLIVQLGKHFSEEQLKDTSLAQTAPANRPFQKEKNNPESLIRTLKQHSTKSRSKLNQIEERIARSREKFPSPSQSPTNSKHTRK